MNRLRNWLVTVVLALAHAATQAPAANPAGPTPPDPSRTLPPLPEAVTSFGAASHQGHLYVLGGHRGERHDYAADFVSGSFHRIRLDGVGGWEALPATDPGQGMPIVGHRDGIFRIGGMTARNRSGEKQDLVSTDGVLRFDLSRRRWERFAQLPEPRSSHDAVVVGDRLYVGGGWSMRGGTNAPVWLDDLLELNLDKPDGGWTRIRQPFKRRALAMAATDARIVFVGGMDSDGRPTGAVDLFDPARRQWLPGPPLPEGRFKGFGCAAAAQGGRIYANAFRGDLLRLSSDFARWENLGRIAHPRMAHRLLPGAPGTVLVVGGEDGESKRPDFEAFHPTTPGAP